MKYKRHRDCGNYYRIYFDDGSVMTISKTKNGEELAVKIITKIQETNYKIRNYYEIDEKVVKVYCYNKKENKEEVCLLDYDFWFKFKECYFSCSQNNGSIMVVYNKSRHHVHRLVMGLYEYKSHDETVDHISKNRFDNRKENLRVVDQSTNMKNQGFFNPNNKSGGVRGVSLTRKKDGYRVRNNKHEEIFFDSFKEAVIYNYEERKKLGYKFYEGSTTIENFINSL